MCSGEATSMLLCLLECVHSQIKSLKVKAGVKAKILVEQDLLIPEQVKRAKSKLMTLGQFSSL